MHWLSNQEGDQWAHQMDSRDFKQGKTGRTRQLVLRVGIKVLARKINGGTKIVNELKSEKAEDL